MSDKNPTHPHAFDDDALPPPDWDPAQDADESWQGLVALMENADAAPTLPAADAEGLRAALRQQLTAEGLIGDKPRNEDASLFAWFRVLLLGGGAGGQVIRLGVAAAITAAVTLQYGDDSRGVILTDRLGRDRALGAPGKHDSRELATVDRNEMKTAGLQNPAGPPPGVSVAMDSAAPTQAAPATASLGVAGEDAKKEKDASEFRESEAGGRRQNLAAAEGMMKRADADLQDSAAPSPKMMQARSAPSISGGTLLGASASTGGPASSELLAEAIEALQVAKVTAGLTTSASNIGELRYVERALLAALSQASVDSEDMQVVVAALEGYSRAEELAEAGRYADAEAAYREAHANSRDSFVGFLSMFQMARLRFESTQDYAGALAAYRSLLDDYPRQFMTEEYRAHVRGRIDLLHRTSADNWADLRRWTMAQQAPTPAASAELLVTLLADYPTSTLAPDAAMRLAELLVDDAAPQAINYADATRVMGEAVRRRELGPDTARIQYALAEAMFRRGLDPDRAIIEYQRALEMKPTAELRATILERLKAAASARIVQHVEPVPATLPASQ